LIFVFDPLAIALILAYNVAVYRDVIKSNVEVKTDVKREIEEKRKAGKSFMIWGLIALFVMVSIWGLVGVLSNTFGINKTLLPQLSQ
jgi:hypothetical protein